MTALSPDDPLHGTRYRCLERIGSGAMGEVFLVEHAMLGKRFVAKVLHTRHAETDEYVARLRLEARALGQIRHTNIVAITDVATTPSGRPFFVMEHLEGQTVHEYLRQNGRMPRAHAVAYTRQMLSALGEAHSRGIVHRDVKPQNLFLQTRSGMAPTLKILDFGAARDTRGLASAGVPMATKTGTVVGTLGYLSPEGAEGHRVDHRADLYAVGLVLTVMLVGRLPKAPAGRAAGVELGEATLELPADAASLAGTILKALAFAPERRFQTAEEFLGALPEA